MYKPSPVSGSSTVAISCTSRSSPESSAVSSPASAVAFSRSPIGTSVRTAASTSSRSAVPRAPAASRRAARSCRDGSATGHARLAQQRAADDQPLHLAGALVEPEQPGVAVEPLDRRGAQVAEPAVHLHRPVDRAANHLGAYLLRRRRADGGVLAAVVAGGDVDHQGAPG